MPSYVSLGTEGGGIKKRAWEPRGSSSHFSTGKKMPRISEAF